MRGTRLVQTEAELLNNPVLGRPTLILRSDFNSISKVVAGPVEVEVCAVGTVTAPRLGEGCTHAGPDVQSAH